MKVQQVEWLEEGKTLGVRDDCAMTCAKPWVSAMTRVRDDARDDLRETLGVRDDARDDARIAMTRAMKRRGERNAANERNCPERNTSAT